MSMFNSKIIQFLLFFLIKLINLHLIPSAIIILNKMFFKKWAKKAQSIVFKVKIFLFRI